MLLSKHKLAMPILLKASVKPTLLSAASGVEGSTTIDGAKDGGVVSLSVSMVLPDLVHIPEAYLAPQPPLGHPLLSTLVT